MTTTIIALSVLSLGIFLLMWGRKDYSRMGAEVSGAIMSLFTLIFLLIHMISIGLSSYNYHVMVKKRDAFELTLKEARESGNELEAAAIVKEVAEWNVWLANQQYDNTTLFFDPYIDDRIDSLKPIR